MPASSLAHLKTAFVAFRNECIWLKTCHDTFDVLFGGDEETKRVLRRAAAAFFDELNVMMIEYWIMAVSRITDPPKTKGHENLTVKNLLEGLKEQKALTPEINDAATALQNYRCLIQNARNKLVSHADKEAFMAKASLGEHSEAELRKFLNDLQIFNDLVGKAIGEGPLDFSGTSRPGDAYDLIHALKGAA